MSTVQSNPVYDSTSTSEFRGEYRIDRATTDESIAQVKKIARNWHTFAFNRYNDTGLALYTKDDPKYRLAFDSQNITKAIKKALAEDTTGRTIYVAYDNNEKAQGIAIAEISSKENELLCLSTNPKNIEFLEWQKGRKGVGKALLTQVVQDVYNKPKNNRTLSLSALSTAVAFYENYGFKHNKKETAERGLKPMIITRAGMKQLMS